MPRTAATSQPEAHPAGSWSPLSVATPVPLTRDLGVASRQNAPEWRVLDDNAGTVSVLGIGTSSTNGGSELRLGGCATPDPFAAIGGGVRYGAGWYPQGIALPGQTPPQPDPFSPQPPPLPPPSPPPPSTCATPDPFVSLGGGTCSGGGWYPPGMTPPGTPLPVTPPPAPGPVTCIGPDPFVSIGGGVCLGGGWIPLGMVGGAP